MKSKEEYLWDFKNNSLHQPVRKNPEQFNAIQQFYYIKNISHFYEWWLIFKMQSESHFLNK